MSEVVSIGELRARRAVREGRESPRLSELPARFEPGARFGHLTALGPEKPWASSQVSWAFDCDCGKRTCRMTGAIRRALLEIGWASCPGCYRAAGGWTEIAIRHRDRVVGDVGQRVLLTLVDRRKVIGVAMGASAGIASVVRDGESGPEAIDLRHVSKARYALPEESLEAGPRARREA